jgi:hypothetical protein
VGTGGAVSVGDQATLKAGKNRALAEAARRTKRFAFGVATSAMERLGR